MQKIQTLAKVLILASLISIDIQAGEVSFKIMEEQVSGHEVLTEKSREMTQLTDNTTPDFDILRAYGIVQPTQEQISFWGERARREERAGRFLRERMMVPYTSLNVAVVIYLQDHVGKIPSGADICTTLNLLGLDSPIQMRPPT